jgi:hypothetical protein
MLKGILPRLSDNEILFIRSFHNNVLIVPEYIAKNRISRSQMNKILRQLQQKHLIVIAKPLRLTRLGKQAYKLYNVRDK